MPLDKLMPFAIPRRRDVSYFEIMLEPQIPLYPLQQFNQWSNLRMSKQIDNISGFLYKSIYAHTNWISDILYIYVRVNQISICLPHHQYWKLCLQFICTLYCIACYHILLWCVYIYSHYKYQPTRDISLFLERKEKKNEKKWIFCIKKFHEIISLLFHLL